MASSDRLQEVFTNSSERNTTGASDWSQVYEAVRWIQLVMALLSVLGSSSIIVCVMLQRLSRTPELQPLVLLSVSDLLLAVCWMIGAVLFSHYSYSSTPCYHLHTVEQILYMTSFCCTFNYILNLYTAIRGHYDCCTTKGHQLQFPDRVSRAAKVCAVLTGLFPVLLMTPVFIQGNISQCQTNFSEPYRCLLMHTGALFLTSEHQQPIRACSLLHTYRITVFLATFLFTLLSISVLVVKARCIYRRVVTSNGYLGNQQRASFRMMDRRMILYPLIFVLCWGPAVSLAFLRLVKPSAGRGEVGVALYISQALTSASQGFLNCLVYGWTRARLRRVLSRDVDTQTPLLRSQKEKRSYQTLRTG